MNRKKNRAGKKSLYKKMLLLIFLLLIFFSVLIFQAAQKKSRHTSSDEEKNESATDVKDGVQSILDTFLQDENEPEESVTDTKKQSEEKARVDLSDPNKLAAQILGDRISLLEEKLAEYNRQTGITAKSATLLEIALSMEDATQTEFYIENEDGSLVTLTWNPYRQIMGAEPCAYTKEEIESAVWLGTGNAPEERGVTPEADQEFYENRSSEKNPEDTVPETFAGDFEQSGEEIL